VQPLPVQQWVHVAATFDDQADFRRIYVNGTRVATEEPMLRDRAAGVTAFGIGESLVFRGRFFQGRIDGVALFDRALPDAVTYSNECFRLAAGATLAHAGACL
jgi:hypothetical protein